MFDHMGIYTGGDLAAARTFYVAVLAPLGVQLWEDHSKPDGTGWLVFGAAAPHAPFFVIAKGKPDWWRPDQQEGQSAIHLAFRAPTKDAVDQFHAIGLSLGARDNGAPRDRGRGNYAAFLIDADSNGIEANFRE